MIKRIAIDLVPIRVGEGGTGSGIWTYARELIHHMDQNGMDGLNVVCLVNQGQLPYLTGLRHIRLIRFPWFGKNILFRLLWIHLFLPLICLFKRVEVLHKLATETPLLCPAKRVTTVCDFYYEYLFEHHSSETIRLYERLENFYFSIVSRTCFHKSCAVISISNATRAEAVRRYPAAADRISTIHLSAASSSPARREKTGDSSARQFTILCVAKFMEHKGQHLLLDAFETMLQDSPAMADSVQLVLRGFHNDADYFNRIQHKATASRFSENIRILDFNPADSLETMYEASDLVVLLSSYEGFGLPVLEAQSMGIPVLCSALPVLQEVGGEGAAYVERDDLSAVADTLRRFITDPAYYEEMQRRAEDNPRRFSWKETARQTLEIYQKV